MTFWLLQKAKRMHLKAAFSKQTIKIMFLLKKYFSLFKIIFSQKKMINKEFLEGGILADLYFSQA